MTSELTGKALDWAAGRALGLEHIPGQPANFFFWETNGGSQSGQFCPSEMWEHAGPIIEREHIELYFSYDSKMWTAFKNTTDSDGVVGGLNLKMTHTKPLTAAMRCLVAHKLGDGVELPEELT